MKAVFNKHTTIGVATMQDPKRRRIAGLTVLALLALALLASLPGILGQRQEIQQGNLIRNGDFSAVTGGMPDDWTTGMWFTSAGTSYLEAVTLEDGTTAALVENAGANDARFEQTVSVRKNATYRLSARVRAEGIDPANTGANLSFSDIYGTSECVYETNGEWVTLTLYAQTGADQSEATVFVRVGGYGSVAQGKAWFTDVELTQVEDVPVGMQALNIAPPAATKETQSGSQERATGIAIPALILAAAAYLAIAWFVVNGALRAGARENLNPKMGWRVELALLLIGAGVLRMVLAALVRGYGVDMGCFTAWAMRMADNGPVHFYAEDYFCDYPPAYMLVLGLLGSVTKAFGFSLSDPLGQWMLKLVPIACDLALALVVFAVVSHEAGRRPALGLAALVALNPAFIVAGSCWGQIDTLLAVLLALMLLAARGGRWNIAIPLFALAVLAKPQAGLLAPLGVAALVRELIGGERKRAGKMILIGLDVGIMLTLAITVPFSIGQESAMWIVDKYLNTLSGYQYATLSTGNVMFLLGGNWVNTAQAVLGPITYGQLGGVLMALSFAAGIAVYLLGKDRGRLMLASAVTMQMVFVCGSMMHERYILPALALLLLAYAETGDARLLASFVLSSAASAVNVGVVLAFDYLMAPNMWLGYIISVAQIAALALTLWAAVGLSTGKGPMHLPAPTAKAGNKPNGQFGGKPGAGKGGAEARMRRELLEAPRTGFHMTRRDWAVMLGITAVYAVIGLWNLGATKAPQTGYTSSAEGETAVLDLGQRQEDFRIYYYGGISDTQFSFATSDDGVTYGAETDAFFSRGECFKWLALRQPSYDDEGIVTGASGSMLTFSGRYLRVTFKGAGAALWEIAAVDENGQTLPVVSAVAFGGREGRQDDGALLVDEQNTVPVKPTYMNSMYFDEIYHARTGYEHAHALYTYETTHPPLGKVFMGMCISLLGMTPFAWRLAGALCGVLMIPAIYLLGKELFADTRWAALCALLLAADCMHYTQTRIATIDSFPVLFIILMFLCMARWMRMSFFHQKLSRTFVPLALSGAFMGLAIASKWIGCYGAVGLAALFFARMGALWRQSVYARAHRKENPVFARAADCFTGNAVKTLAACVVFFVIVPIVIYCLSYIPYLRAYGPVRLNLSTLDRLWKAQVGMLNYHKNLVATHFFASVWYEWPIIGKPMWYYSADYVSPGMASSILSFGNPAVWWTGLAGILFVLVYSAYRNALPALRVIPGRDDVLDRAMPVIAVGFLSAYLPWVLVPRLTFIYHYFASVPFIIVATAQALRYLERRRPKLALAIAAGLSVAAVALFIAFFPLASGIEVPRAWCDAVNWFDGWMWY